MAGFCLVVRLVFEELHESICVDGGVAALGVQDGCYLVQSISPTTNSADTVGVELWILDCAAN